MTTTATKAPTASSTAKNSESNLRVKLFQDVDPMVAIYTTTKSPRDLMLVIMQTLDPDYHMTVAKARDVYKMLKCHIVPGPPPPKSDLSVTRRKAKYKHRKEAGVSRLGRATSHFCAPDTINQSFYLHHTMPLFSTLLPQVDLSTYERPKPIKEEGHSARTQFPTPESERASSPPLPSSPPEFLLVVEDYDEGVAKAIQPNVDDEDLLPGEIGERVTTEDPATKFSGYVLDQDGVDRKSGTELLETQMTGSQVFSVVNASPSNPVPDNLTQDTFNFRLTVDDAQQSIPSVDLNSNPAKLRRSSRLAKTPGGMSKDPDSVPAGLNTLGKRSRGAAATRNKRPPKWSKS